MFLVPHVDCHAPAGIQSRPAQMGWRCSAADQGQADSVRRQKKRPLSFGSGFKRTGSVAVAWPVEQVEGQVRWRRGRAGSKHRHCPSFCWTKPTEARERPKTSAGLLKTLSRCQFDSAFEEHGDVERRQRAGRLNRPKTRAGQIHPSFLAVSHRKPGPQRN